MKAVESAKLTARGSAALRELLRSKMFLAVETIVYETFGVPLRVTVCPELSNLSEYSIPLNPFCELVSSTKLGRQRCEASSRREIKKVLAQGKARVSRCLAGMTKILVPVQAGIETVAVLTATEVLDHHPTEKMFASAWSKFQDVGIPRSKLREAYFATPVISREYAQAVGGLIQLVAQLVLESELRIWQFRRDPADGVIQAVRKFVEKEYVRAVRLEEIAQQVHLSHAYLSRLFKKKTGLRLFDFLAQVRVEEAKKLLWTTERKISDIAKACGFRSPTHLARTFRTKTGLSPRVYRAKFRPVSGQQL